MCFNAAYSRYISKQFSTIMIAESSFTMNVKAKGPLSRYHQVFITLVSVKYILSLKLRGRWNWDCWLDFPCNFSAFVFPNERILGCLVRAIRKCLANWRETFVSWRRIQGNLVSEFSRVSCTFEFIFFVSFLLEFPLKFPCTFLTKFSPKLSRSSA